MDNKGMVLEWAARSIKNTPFIIRIRYCLINEVWFDSGAAGVFLLG